MNTLYFVICAVLVANLSTFSTAQVCDRVCVTRTGLKSGTDKDSISEATCEVGKFLTGCSSYSEDSSERAGEQIKRASNGRVGCIATNGENGSGTRAYARCCKWPHMRCNYVNGNKSSTPDDDGSMAFCPDKINCFDAFVTGCSLRSPWKGLTGAKPMMPNYCLGYNENVDRGLWVSSACCSASNFNCNTKSVQTGTVEGDKAVVGCDDGWILTGCSVRNPNHPTRGAYIDEDDNCVAVNGADGKAIWAIAVCCKDTY
ncbi:proprotein convertase subtilisin/kexin type 9-like [Saccoglossus kowalevskii]|uniref:Proprotein convertase subtilisin/kexin type 9-like n=1 Tax=Saccoglossus kowalevskii TaxID=10224 RepID=A0ABM0MIW1_SACKO|nr:PREDICTED: proprotein convertase subtilisin/kexin type 9-like [Saccoglossus kowalevskii]